MSLANSPIEIGTGPELRCRGWRQEGLLRMLENTLAHGEKPEQLIIYGGSGRVARNWPCFHAIVSALQVLEGDQTLMIQSGKPVAVFTTSESSPRVLTANTNLVGRWATWENLPRARGQRPDHVRAVHRRHLVLYRCTGNSTGDLRDLRFLRETALRRIIVGTDCAHRGAGGAWAAPSR